MFREGYMKTRATVMKKWLRLDTSSGGDLGGLSKDGRHMPITEEEFKNKLNRTKYTKAQDLIKSPTSG